MKHVMISVALLNKGVNPAGLKRIVLATTILVVTWSGASLKARADTLNFGGGTFSPSPTGVVFSGTPTVSSGTGIFAPLAAPPQNVTTQNLNFTVTTPLNQAFLLTNFLTFSGSSMHLDLTFINLGVNPQVPCTAGPAPFQTCTPAFPGLVTPANAQGLSPYNFTNTLGGGSSLSFNVSGTVVNGATTTPFFGVFSTQFTVPYQTVLASWVTGPTAPISYSATITTTSTVPEPATMLLLGTGLAGIGAKVRQRRKAV